MATQKRRRGRPRGSGKDDARNLMQVADLLIREPELKPTTAMKRVIRSGRAWKENDATLLRRWQVKWRANGMSLLTAARDRTRRPISYVPISLQDIKRIIDPWSQYLTMLENSPVMEAIKAMENSPINQAIKAMENSPINQAIKAMENSPINLAIKTMEKFRFF